MAEETVLVAILLNNENIPKDIFKSSIDEYFGPQVEDFKESFLSVCILSEKTGTVPTKTNAATFSKSQWLFMTNFIPDEIFEFKVAICDNQTWNIILSEDLTENRLIKTFQTSSDNAIVIHLEWNKPHTVSVESLLDIHSMDESLLKSNYENPEISDTIMNLETINEDNNDDESLVDSLKAESNKKDNDNVDSDDTEDSLEPEENLEKDLHEPKKEVVQDDQDVNYTNSRDSLEQTENTDVNKENVQIDSLNVESVEKAKDTENELEQQDNNNIGLENEEPHNIPELKKEIIEQNQATNANEMKIGAEEELEVSKGNDEITYLDNQCPISLATTVINDDNQPEKLEEIIPEEILTPAENVHVDEKLICTVQDPQVSLKSEDGILPITSTCSNDELTEKETVNVDEMNDKFQSKEMDIHNLPELSEDSIPKDTLMNAEENDINNDAIKKIPIANSEDTGNQEDIVESEKITQLNEEKVIEDVGNDLQNEKDTNNQDIVDSEKITQLNEEKVEEDVGKELENEKDTSNQDIVESEKIAQLNEEKVVEDVDNDLQNEKDTNNQDIVDSEKITQLNEEKVEEDVGKELENEKDTSNQDIVESEKIAQLNEEKVIEDADKDLENVKDTGNQDIIESEKIAQLNEEKVAEDVVKDLENEKDTNNQDIVESEKITQLNEEKVAEDVVKDLENEKDTNSQDIVESEKIVQLNEEKVVENVGKDIINTSDILQDEDVFYEETGNLNEEETVNINPSNTNVPITISSLSINFEDKPQEIDKIQSPFFTNANENIHETEDKNTASHLEMYTNNDAFEKSFSAVNAKQSHTLDKCEVKVTEPEIYNSNDDKERDNEILVQSNLNSVVKKEVEDNSELIPCNNINIINKELESQKSIYQAPKNVEHVENESAEDHKDLKTEEINKITAAECEKHVKHETLEDTAEKSGNPSNAGILNSEDPIPVIDIIKKFETQNMQDENTEKLIMSKEKEQNILSPDEIIPVGDIIKRFETEKKEEISDKVVLRKEKEKEENRISRIVSKFEEFNLPKDSEIIISKDVNKTENMPNKDRSTNENKEMISDNKIGLSDVKNDGKENANKNDLHKKESKINKIKMTDEYKKFSGEYKTDKGKEIKNGLNIYPSYSNRKNNVNLNQPSTFEPGVVKAKEVKIELSQENKLELRVNDDYKYPDSVTPTKVEHGLSKLKEYDVPYMDDDMFYKENWYKESNDRWSNLDDSKNSNDELHLTPVTENVLKNTPKASIETLTETEIEKVKQSIERATPETKRKGILNLCGCVGGRKRS